MSVAILHEGDYLIAVIQSDLTDSQVVALRDELTERVRTHRARGVIIDVTAMDVIDSFVARSLRRIAVTTRLRGAETVIVGIQPDVAIALVQFNVNFSPLQSALDLAEGRALLDSWTRRGVRDAE